MKRTIISLCFLLVLGHLTRAQNVRAENDTSARVRYGIGKLKEVMRGVGASRKVIVRVTGAGEPEAFRLRSDGATIYIEGSDASGALYGCMELADRVRHSGWPTGIDFSDRPEMRLRGACIGVQKPTLLPGRGPYEYPYTPANFPWFYDKALWVQYLDSLAVNRMNSLYLWNGHPFASLLRLREYPYAVEVDDATLTKNEAMYRWLGEEAGRRGIWVIQLFYNIIVSKPFADSNHIRTQDRNRHIVPLIADYTRKSIAAFVAKYPNVGLMVTLGEAMEGTGPDDVEWFTKTIIPGIRDGLRMLGKKDEPPVVLRAHDTDAPTVLAAALPLYSNLYVEAKYNGEALTTFTPHGSWAALHRQLSKAGKGLIENVHILANLEPFRYGSADFIQRSVEAMHSIYGANGLHLYPQASYWDWPYTADKSSPRLLEIERDWIWYREWARYAWRSRRDRAEEVDYWSGLLADHFGCTTAEGRRILSGYEAAGEIEPMLLRRYGITDGNRQTLTLGMLMTQLIHPERFGLFPLLYESEGPPGEMLGQYAEREWKGLGHEGETPVMVADAVEAAGRKAVAAVEGIRAGRRRTEFLRLINDLYCQQALGNCYAMKARAAVKILRYKFSRDLNDLVAAYSLMQNGLAAFRSLDSLAGPAYLYANSMQTMQRKIPMRGADGKFIRWSEMVPVYEQELANFGRHLDSLQQGSIAGAVSDQLVKWAPVTVTCEQSGGSLNFTVKEPVELLVGFFRDKRTIFTRPPQLETDANANDHGQADVRFADWLLAPGLPLMDVHAWSFGPGSHQLSLGPGICMVLGFVKPLAKGVTADPSKRELDWLFE